VNAAGANAANRRELDGEAVLKADLRFTDSVVQARVEAGEFIDLIAAKKLDRNDVHEIGDLVSGTVAGRTTPKQITLFKSLGIALEDVALAELVYRRAIGR
jgi:ornithine cyclodeaminase/alanine dehydrogenase-like protein (mu-crystallin family)